MTTARATAFLPMDPDAIDAFCRSHRVERLSVFGSFGRGEQPPESDLDLLVEFEPGLEPGMDLVRMEIELSDLAGRRVDLRRPHELSRYIREWVLQEAKQVYVR